MIEININEFKDQCLRDCKDIRDGAETYFYEHLNRLYNTFCIARYLLDKSATKKILSIGAGPAFVESQLTKFCEANISIIDFPEAIEIYGKHFKKYGFKSYPMNLSEKKKLNNLEKYDIILSCEVIEHLTISPIDFINNFVDNLTTNGYFLITTPNFARFTSCIKLLLNLPLLPDAQLTFSPVCFENEGIHRREYVNSEIVNAFNKNHLKHIKTKYTVNNKIINIKNILLDCILIPRFKPTMIIVGQKI